MIYMILADGFEETEAIMTWDIIKRAQMDIKLASLNENREAKGTHGLVLKADITVGGALKEIQEAKASARDVAVILPGGMPGAENIYQSKEARELISFAYDIGGYICAICASPSVFGRMGLLKGKKATCFPSFERYFDGGEYIPERVVRDGRIITAMAMGCSADFALEIVKSLRDENTANNIRESAYL